MQELLIDFIEIFSSDMYFYTMRYICAVLMIIWFLGSVLFAGDWEESLKLTSLIEHYHEHTHGSFTVVSFVDFIADHYLNEVAANDSSHDSLPFFHHHLPLSAAIIPYFNFNLILHEFQPEQNPAHKVWTPVSHPVLILQPPKA